MLLDLQSRAAVSGAAGAAGRCLPEGIAGKDHRRAVVHGVAGDGKGKGDDLVRVEDAKVIAEVGADDAQLVDGGEHEDVPGGNQEGAQAVYDEGREELRARLLPDRHGIPIVGGGSACSSMRAIGRRHDVQVVPVEAKGKDEHGKEVAGDARGAPQRPRDGLLPVLGAPKDIPEEGIEGDKEGAQPERRPGPLDGGGLGEEGRGALYDRAGHRAS